MTEAADTDPADAAVHLPPAGRYRIEPERSSITFQTRHLFGLAAVHGSFSFISGEIIVPESGEDWSASATVDASSFQTNHSRRDKDVKSRKFLEVESHPEITFASTHLTRSADTWLLHGRLTARGTAAPTELTVHSLDADAARLTGRATTRVDRYAHGITKAKGMAGRYLDLEITVHAIRE